MPPLCASAWRPGLFLEELANVLWGNRRSQNCNACVPSFLRGLPAFLSERWQTIRAKSHAAISAACMSQ